MSPRIRCSHLQSRRRNASSLHLALALLLIAAPRPASAADNPPTAQETTSPETLPYDPNQPIPSGYHVEPNRAGSILMICGGITFAAFGSLAIVGYSQPDDPENIGHGLGAFGLVGMALSAPVFIVGLTLPKHVLKKNESFEWHIAPRLARDASGIGITGAF